MTTVQQTLHQELGPYLRSCFKCQAKIPTSCKICWRCGELLDPRLIELAKPAKEAKP